MVLDWSIKASSDTTNIGIRNGETILPVCGECLSGAVKPLPDTIRIKLMRNSDKFE